MSFNTAELWANMYLSSPT